jgi:tRNA pseudouridine38-40 synthase
MRSLMMRNIKLTVAYDGTDFHGWQVQPGQPTVQGTLTDVAEELTQERITLQAAGRTDAGVHAWGQVANFETHSELAPGEFARAFNALLPPSIRVRTAERVGPEFHARWLAQAKTYQYRIYRGRVVPPFHWRYVLHDTQPLDFAAMAEAARCFEGEHDFTSFAASTGSEEDDRERTMLRTIYRSEVVVGSAAGTAPSAEEPQEWVYVVKGKSFLRYMVRKIVGTLVEVGRGRMVPSDIQRVFELCDRSRSGPTMPAQGLCLMSVEYPDPTESGTEVSLPDPQSL